MNLHSRSFTEGGPLPERYALLRNEGPTTVGPAENINPHLAWSEAPEATASFTVLCVDLDSPTDHTDANRPGSELADAVPRRKFFHWVLVDLPPDVRDIDEGAFVPLVRPDSRQAGDHACGREGMNDFATGLPETLSIGQGYGGPAPPWNDARVHRYRFTVYAIAVPRLNLSTDFSAVEVLQAMQGHVLDEASLTGIYTLNSALAPQQIGSLSVT